MNLGLGINLSSIRSSSLLGLADTVATPTASYSLRNLSISYFGQPVVRVRRESDDVEQDFTASQITDGTLGSFCTGTNGFVHTWYDQSGNGYDAVQVTNTDQPKIWDSVTGLVTENGKPAIEFDGVDDSLATTGYIVELSANDASVFAVVNAVDDNYILAEADVADPYSSNFILGGPSSGNITLWVNATTFGSAITGQTLAGFIYDGTNFQAYQDGLANGASGTATVNAEALNQTVIGARADQTVSFYSGSIQELITYKSDQSANRTAIESNINGYYDIFDDSVIYFQGFEYRVVYNPVTGRYWLDRNLGATQVATSISDSNAYGDLYQWGRYAEGHQLRSSSTTTTLATTEAPNTGGAWDGDFITTSASPNDWLATPDDNLWQGVNGVNVPAPAGFRLPTEAEWDEERASWSNNDNAGAFASPLKLPSAGFRSRVDGSVGLAGSNGFYWSSTVDGSSASRLNFGSSNASMGSSSRANGFSVRLIKDES